MIPPEQNVPRNNTVQGDVRKPQLNVNMIGRSGSAVVRRAEAMPLPPVDAQTQARAEQMTTPSAPQATTSDRRMPLQNSQFQVSSNSYPPINSVPPRPAISGPDSAPVRLNATQAELENQRAVAVEQKETLAKDAAAEPSMLSELPKTDGVVPLADPVVVAPAAVSQPVPTPQEIRPASPAPAPTSSVTVPIKETQAVASTAVTQNPAPQIELSAAPVPSRLPALPVFAPPTPLNAQAVNAVSAPVVVPVAVSSRTVSPTANAQPVAMAPVLTPEIAAAPVAVAEPEVLAAAPTVKKGDFDPLAVADNTPIASPASSAKRTVSSASYVSNRYIAPSRYAGRRY